MATRERIADRERLDVTNVVEDIATRAAERATDDVRFDVNADDIALRLTDSLERYAEAVARRARDSAIRRRDRRSFDRRSFDREDYEDASADLADAITNLAECIATDTVRLAERTTRRADVRARR
jgi:histone H3/H4